MRWVKREGLIEGGLLERGTYQQKLTRRGNVLEKEAFLKGWGIGWGIYLKGGLVERGGRGRLI